VRGLSPLSTDDNRLLQAISRGEFAITGFRNRDLREILHGEAADATEARRQSSRVTRQLRLLRAHGLIQKVAKTHRYQLTTQGQVVIAALLSAQQASPAKLKQLAA
jgi:DNA-binding HxlR family transcriptional regulator